jgi:outer membrane receptor protein involved in Fe transport
VFHSNNIITNNQSNKGTMYFGEYQMQRKFKSIGMTFTGGVVGNISYSSSKLYASSGTPNNKIVNASGYMQLDKKFWHVLNLSGGIRYEYFKMNNLQSVVAPIYRAGANLQITKGTFVRTSYGQGYRYPTITERYITTKAGMFGVFPNPDLKPETSKSFEIGLKQGYKIGNCMGYFDIAGFYQQYKNTIEYLFGVWEPEIALVGFKFLNTGNSRVRGIDMSLAAATPETNKRFGVFALIGYTYIEPITLSPDSVYARDKSLGGFGQDLTYKTSSLDTTDNILKYRFKHMFKSDIEFRIYKFSVGFSYRYYSKMQNIDRAFQDIEVLTDNAYPYINKIKGIEFWKKNEHIHVFDCRMSYKLNDNHKISLVCSNVLNKAYSLRPLKIEAPRTTSIQYVFNF